MSTHVVVLWSSDLLLSSERCVVHAEPRAAVIEGVVVLPLGDIPASISYSIDVEPDWTTRHVAVELAASESSQEIRLERQDGSWTVNGHARPDLDGCDHVDLGWSPVTNTLPLRHAALEVGASCTARSAWVRFPQFDVVATEQTYTRVDDATVRYQSPTFQADLVVSPDDLVTTYGDDLWRAEKLHRVV